MEWIMRLKHFEKIVGQGLWQHWGGVFTCVTKPECIIDQEWDQLAAEVCWLSNRRNQSHQHLIKNCFICSLIYQKVTKMGQMLMHRGTLQILERSKRLEILLLMINIPINSSFQTIICLQLRFQFIGFIFSIWITRFILQFQILFSDEVL